MDKEEFSKYKLYRRFYSTDGINWNNPIDEYEAVKVPFSENDCDCGYRYIQYDKVGNRVLLDNTKGFTLPMGDSFTINVAFRKTATYVYQERYFYDFEFWIGDYHFKANFVYGDWVRYASTTSAEIRIPLMRLKCYKDVYVNCDSISNSNNGNCSVGWSMPDMLQFEYGTQSFYIKPTIDVEEYIYVAFRNRSGGLDLNDMCYGSLTITGYPFGETEGGYEIGRNNYYCKGVKYEDGDMEEKYVTDVIPTTKGYICGSQLGSQYDRNKMYEIWQDKNNENSLFYLETDYTCGNVPSSIHYKLSDLKNLENKEIGYIETYPLNCQNSSTMQISIVPTYESGVYFYDNFKVIVTLYREGEERREIIDEDTTLDISGYKTYTIGIRADDSDTFVIDDVRAERGKFATIINMDKVRGRVEISLN